MTKIDNVINKALPVSLKTEFGSSQSSDMIIEQLDPDRGNRICVTISDIHLTDGTVGIQNLADEAWDNFFAKMLDNCQQYQANELVLVLDGDVVDLIRSGVWVENNIYPWDRQRKQEFDATVFQIIKKIVTLHHHFFSLVKNMDQHFKTECSSLNKTDIIILLGNHDKELLMVNEALAYFYEQALGKKLEDFSEQERKTIGTMYGDETLFADKRTAPYFRFYYGDTGLRFFTTHGQWRDSENSRGVKAKDGDPGWSVKDGWRPDIWGKLHYAPFLLPCFGDTVAAGVLSTFICKSKDRLKQESCATPRLNRILDELDLYRPSYLAPQRILKETASLKKQSAAGRNAARIIEDTLVECIINWLSWDFTYQSASPMLGFLLKVAKWLIIALEIFGKGMKLALIVGVLKLLNHLSHHNKPGVSLDEMKKFPPFLAKYRDLKLQIHGEGHTHKPLQEEARIDESKTNYTYINYGTWRDQIVAKKNSGYRRRGVLRFFNILDIKSAADPKQRRYGYFTQDVIIWSDELDSIDAKEIVARRVSSTV